MKRRVPVGDIRIGREERSAVLDVLDRGRISEGPKVRQFEDAWAGYVGTRHCVAVSSGTAALMVGLMSLINDQRHPKVRPGGKVVVSPVTYISTVNAITLCGLEPVFVDIDPRTFTLLPGEVEDLVRKSPDDYSIILPVHLMGYPNDMDALNDIATRHGLVTFEDSAQAHGSRYKGRKAGSMSLLSSFSFYIAHNIQAGELGAITSDDLEIMKSARRLKANGRMCGCRQCTRHKGACPQKEDGFDPRFTHGMVGYNFKTTEFPAALALCQVEKADMICSSRRRNVSMLNYLLSETQDVLSLPVYSDDVSYLAYPIVIKDGKIRRGELLAQIEEQGVETRPLFGCIPTQQPAYSCLKARYEGRLPAAEMVGARGFYVGCHQYLEEEDLVYMAETIKKAVAKPKDVRQRAADNVSVVVSVKNSDDVIEDCLEAVKSNNPFEIIVVDGGSSDRTLEVAGRYTDRIFHDGGGGIALARQIGMENASGDFVAHVGPDNIMPPGSLAAMRDELVRKGYAGIQAQVRRLRNSSYWDWGMAQYFELTHNREEEREVIGTPNIYLRSAAIKVSFDPSINEGADDTDFCVRLRDAGYRIGVGSVVAHEIGNTGLHEFKKRWEWYGRGDVQFMLKHRDKALRSLTHPFRSYILRRSLIAVKAGRLNAVPFFVLCGLFRYAGMLKGLSGLLLTRFKRGGYGSPA